MNRREVLVTGSLIGLSTSSGARAQTQSAFSYSAPVVIDERLPVPKQGKIRVGFTINPGVQVIDLAGPWEVFQDVLLSEGESPLGEERPFELFTVSESIEPLTATGGLQIVPNYSIEGAPIPHLVVIPHFASTELTPIHEWITEAAERADLTMSICTGAFQLARTGLLDGRPATTNQDAYNLFERVYPQVSLRRGPRFVETTGIATSGGLTAGIDLALRVVERYFGRSVAQRTADAMEYTSEGWKT